MSNLLSWAEAERADVALIIARHRQGPYFSGATEASWVAMPGLALVNLLEHENDLLAAHVLTIDTPAAQFLG